MAATIRMLLIGGVVLVMLCALGLQFGFSPPELLRDPDATGIAHRAAGSISNLGVAMMGIAAVCTLAAAALRRDGRMLFLAVFAFSAIFALDDGLMFHDELGAWEFGVYAAYGFLALAIGGLIVAERAGPPFSWPYLAFFACFIASALVDLIWQSGYLDWAPYGETLAYTIEDALKFVGIFDFVVLWVSESAAHVRRRPVVRSVPVSAR